MPVKRKNKQIRQVTAVCIFMMLLQVSGYAAAGGEAFSRAPDAGLQPVPISEPVEASGSLPPDVGESRIAETGEILKVPLHENWLSLPPGEGCPIEWKPAKMNRRQAFVKLVEAYNLMDANQPFLGFGWGRDEKTRNKWKVFFGPGFYISHHDWNHPTENFDFEEKISNRDESDLFEEIKKAFKAVGFQIRYDF